jgi:hypothetical protein
MFQSASKKEIKRIACGAVLLTVAMWVVYALLGVFGVAALNGKIVLSSLVGSAVAVGNFAALCLMVQKAAAVGDDKGRAKAIVQLSYNLRLTVQAVWVVLAFVLPCFSVIAGAVPLLFPRLVIYYLQLTGQYKSETSAAVSADSADAEDDAETEEPESPEQQPGQDTMS